MAWSTSTGLLQVIQGAVVMLLFINDIYYLVHVNQTKVSFTVSAGPLRQAFASGAPAAVPRCDSARSKSRP